MTQICHNISAFDLSFVFTIPSPKSATGNPSHWIQSIKSHQICTDSLLSGGPSHARSHARPTTNNWHQIRNDSADDRYHIICDFYDTKGVTKGFSYKGNIQELEDHAKLMRQKIDEAVIEPELLKKFEEVRQTFVTKKVQ